MKAHSAQRVHLYPPSVYPLFIMIILVIYRAQSQSQLKLILLAQVQSRNVDEVKEAALRQLCIMLNLCISKPFHTFWFSFDDVDAFFVLSRIFILKIAAPWTLEVHVWWLEKTLPIIRFWYKLVACQHFKIRDSNSTNKTHWLTLHSLSNQCR